MRAWPRSPGRAGSLVDTDRPIEVLFEREGLVWYRHLEFQSGQDPDMPRRCFEDNARGRKTKEIDPLDVHGNNNTPDAGDGIDLLQVKRKSGAVYDVLETRPYNAQHLPLTVTDAAGQTTTYTYQVRSGWSRQTIGRCPAPA